MKMSKGIRETGNDHPRKPPSRWEVVLPMDLWQTDLFEILKQDMHLCKQGTAEMNYVNWEPEEKCVGVPENI